MEIFIKDVTEVLTRKITKHGIIHGLDSFHGHTVKVFILKSDTPEVPGVLDADQPYSEEVEISKTRKDVVRGESGSYPEREIITDDTSIDTSSLIRGFISK